MNEAPIINWDSMADASKAINDWANRTFPGRGPKSSINKLGMEELPELLIHLKEHGPEGIGEEWADCLILLLDLARIWKIDPATAIRNKMEINMRRHWKQDPETGFYNHVAIKPPEVDFSSADKARRICKEHGVELDFDMIDACWYCPKCPHVEKL